MRAETANPGAPASATGALKTAIVGNAGGLENSDNTLRLQAARLARRFGLSAALARLVGSQSFGEERP